ncbi:MAG: cbb3-type cytochrome c oxidase subunit I, partial [Verrucomicrobia bacterium]|nr:cbb3-type cytochrome c oxidase subunit I [Verrucomicrobiota bacterium]
MNHPAVSAQSSEYVSSADPGISSATDRAVRVPILLFAGSAVFWLFWSSLFWMLSAMQAADPNVFFGIAWLSYGRAYPIFQNTFVYGWASSAAIAIGFWLIARLSRSVPRPSSIPVYAAILWNIGLVIGVLAILVGAGNGKDFLEFPGQAAFCLFWAFVLADIWAVLVYANQTSRSLYISEWYVVAAFLCFPWMYATATILLNGSDFAGVSQSVVHSWFVGCLFSLWLAPIALAAAYYLIPKIVGNSIASDRLAQLGFWGWIFLSGWIGMTFIIGGPVPAWMVTFGIVARVLSIIAVIAVALNLHLTMKSNFEALSWNPALRFIVVGSMAFAVFGVAASLLSFRTVASITQFTMVVPGHWQFGLFAFISLIFFGA